jgi:hypothetical protein
LKSDSFLLNQILDHYPNIANITTNTIKIITIGIRKLIKLNNKGPQKGRVINKKTIAANSKMKTISPFV